MQDFLSKNDSLEALINWKETEGCFKDDQLMHMPEKQQAFYEEILLFAFYNVVITGFALFVQVIWYLFMAAIFCKAKNT